MSAVNRQTPIGWTHLAYLNAEQIRLRTKLLQPIATSGSASDIVAGVLPVSSVPPLDGSIITTGSVPVARLPASVQNSAATTDIWTGFNQHSLSLANNNPMGTGAFLSWGRDGAGRTAFGNQPGSGQVGGWEFVTYASNAAFSAVAATLSSTGTLQLPAINNNGQGLTIADGINLAGHVINGVTSLANGGSGISIPENIAMGGKALSGVSSIGNGGGGISMPENIALGTHAISGVTQLSNGGAGIAVPENVIFSHTTLSGVATVSNGGAGVSIPENIALGTHAITGLSAISNNGNGIAVNDSLILGNKPLTGVASMAISGTSPTPLSVYNPSLAAGGTVGIGLGANASGASLVFTAATSAAPQSVSLKASTGGPGLTVWGNGAVSSMATGYLMMRAFDESGSSSPHFCGGAIETRLVSSISFGVNSAYALGAPPFAPRSTNVSMRITGSFSANTAGATSFQLVYQGFARVWVASTRLFDAWTGSTGVATLTASVTLPAAPVPIMIEFATGSGSGQLGLQVQVGGSYAPLASGGTLSFDMYEAPPTQFGTSTFNNGLVAPSLSNNGNGVSIPENTSFAGKSLMNVASVSNAGSGVTIPETLTLSGRGISLVSSLANGGAGISTSDPWYFGGLLTSSSIISFGQPPATTSCLLSLYGPSGITRATTTFYGLGLASSALAYRVPSTSCDHVFFGGTTELGRVRGAGGLLVPGSSTFSGGIVTPSVNNGSAGVTSGEVWTFTNSVVVPTIGNGGNGVTSSDTWRFTGNVAFGTSHTPSYSIDCNSQAYISSLLTPIIANSGSGLTIQENTNFSGCTVTCGAVAAASDSSFGGALTVSGSSSLQALSCSSITDSGTLAVTGGATLSSSLTVAGSTGIGTTTPAFPLEIFGSGPFVRIGGNGGAGNQVGLILSPWTGRSGGSPAVITAVDDGNASAHMLFSTAAAGSGTTATERMRLQNNGMLGIGTSSPGYLMDVNGTMRASGAAVFGSSVTSAQSVVTGTEMVGYAAGAAITANMKLDVNGNINFQGSLYQAGVPYVSSQWTTTGNTITYNGNAITPATSGATDVGSTALKWGTGFYQNTMNIGYGTGTGTSSGMTLDVNGNINFTGNLYYKGTLYQPSGGSSSSSSSGGSSSYTGYGNPVAATTTASGKSTYSNNAASWFTGGVTVVSVFDTNSAFNISNGQFTAPVAGLYAMYFDFRLPDNASATAGASWSVNGTLDGYQAWPAGDGSGNNRRSVAMASTKLLNKGDVVFPAIILPAGASVTFNGLALEMGIAITPGAPQWTYSSSVLSTTQQVQVGYPAGTAITSGMEFDVSGNINFTGGLYQNSVPWVSSQWTTAGAGISYGASTLTQQGRFTLGATSSSNTPGMDFLTFSGESPPGARMDVADDGNSSANITFSNRTGGSNGTLAPRLSIAGTSGAVSVPGKLTAGSLVAPSLSNGGNGVSIPEKLTVPTLSLPNASSFTGRLSELQGSNAGVPIGTIIMWTTANSTPSPFWTCNGQEMPRNGYPKLFAVIGTTYGSGDGSTTFNVPNMQGRVPVGYVPNNADSNFQNMGQTGGVESVTLSVANLPSHSHGVSDPGHSHGWSDYNTRNFSATGGGQPAPNPYSRTGAETGGSGTGISIQSTGSGAAFSTLPPYMTIKYLICADQ